MTNPTTEPTIAERVARGAALLDEKRPGWANRIIQEDLDMTSCHDCILGQVYGDYEIGWHSLDLQSGSEFGFDLPGGWYCQMPALADAWRAEIRRRTGQEARP